MGLKGQKLLDRPFGFSQGTAEFCFFLPSDSVDDTRIATDTYGHHIKQVHRSSCRRPRKRCESGARDEQYPSNWPINKNPDVQLLCSHYCQIARAFFFFKYVFCSELKCFKIWPTLRSQWPTVRKSHKPNFIHHPQVITYSNIFQPSPVVGLWMVYGVGFTYCFLQPGCSLPLPLPTQAGHIFRYCIDPCRCSNNLTCRELQGFCTP